MSELTTTCYRHPDRETGVSCQRCERFICTACASPGAVGFLCPEDAKDRVKIRRPRSSSLMGSAPVTMALIGINLLVFLAELVIPNFVYSVDYVNVGPTYEQGTLLRVFTSAFAHSPTQFSHILFNMYSLFILGTLIEPMLGKARFITLYVLSILGGGIGILLLAPFGTSVVGASGAVFGLMGAYLVLLRALKLEATQMYVVIGINLFLGFLPGIAWQGHIGGLVIGLAAAFILVLTRDRSKLTNQIIGLSALTALLLAIWFGANGGF